MKRYRVKFLAVVVAGLVAAAGCSSSSKSGSASVRGFNGTTITVAGIDDPAFFPAAEVGAEARFMRANNTNELNGIKIKFVEMANDGNDAGTALSQIRQLVTQSGIFALVPNLSYLNPQSYLSAQQVPYVGYAIDSTYCSPTATTTLWGFGFNGCLVPTNPPAMPNLFGPLYNYVSTKTGNMHPTMVIFGGDTTVGQTAAKLQASAAQGTGFSVVSAKGEVPLTASDYTPYVQQWLTAAGGKAPDTIVCLLTTQCVGAWAAVKAAGYKGYFYDTLGNVDALAKAMAGTVTTAFYNTAPNPGLTQMEKDLNAFKPGTAPVSYSNVPAYFAADMFVQAVKAVGKSVTPQAVQKALSTIHWQISGLVGPIQYPASTAVQTPSCAELLLAAPDGSGYQIVEPYACSTKQFPVDPKFTG